MPHKFSRTSLERLHGVHPALQDLCFALLLYHDIRITYGLRSIHEQQRLVEQGLSKTMNSKHLIQQDGYAHAVDMCPYPIDWNDTKRFYWVAGMARVLADRHLPDGWVLRWGGNWDMDEDLNDQTFMDLAHFEIREIKSSG
jgi:peptidoglycan L-alanyl-D-glutamate endopeptidase CwlK